MTKLSVDLPQGDCILIKGIINAAHADDYFHRLQHETDWQQPIIKLFGRQIRSPRLHAWHGDAAAIYTWSGVRYEPVPWTPLLLQIRHLVETATELHFNSVLLNYYRHNKDSMGLHSDDEKELGEQPSIASLSLGATRIMSFKSKTNHAATIRIPLTTGSLLLMQGDTQKYWKHGIAKTRIDCGGRINLTFRKIIVR